MLSQGGFSMADITIHLRDGTVQEFPHKGRPGGDYTKRIKYEGGFAVVTDEYYNSTAIPESLIARIEVKPSRRWGYSSRA